MRISKRSNMDFTNKVHKERNKCFSKKTRWKTLGINRRVIVVTLIAVLLTSIVPTFAFAAQNNAINMQESSKIFVDLKTSHWAYSYINKLIDKGIISGYTDNTFKPDAKVSRAEFVKMLSVTTGLSTSGAGSNPFNDIDQAHWAFKYIRAAKEAGIVNGYSDGSFKADKAITRAEVAALIVKAGNYDVDTSTVAPPDIQSFNWAYNFVLTVKKRGIMNGNTDGTFSPEKGASRAEAAKVLSNLLTKVLGEQITNPVAEATRTVSTGGGSSNGSGSEPPLTPIIPETTKILSGRTAATMVVDPGNLGTITFNGDATETAQARSLKPGDVLVAGVTDGTPKGLLRKVKSVSADTDTVQVSTEQASLEDAIEQGLINKNQTISQEDIVEEEIPVDGVTVLSGGAVVRSAASLNTGTSDNKKAAASINLKAISSNKLNSTSGSESSKDSNGAIYKAQSGGANEFYLALDDVVIYDEDDSTSTTDDQVRINGEISLDPVIDFDLKIVGGELKKALLKVTTDEKFEINISSKIDKDAISEKKNIYSATVKPITVMVGDMPVVLEPHIKVYVGADGKVSTSLSAGVSQEATVIEGLELLSGKWEPIKGFTNNYQWDEPTSTVDLNIKTNAAFDVGIRLYGEQLLTVDGDGYITYDVDQSSDPKWKLYLGLEANAHIVNEVIRKVTGVADIHVLSWNKLIAQSSGSGGGGESNNGILAGTVSDGIFPLTGALVKMNRNGVEEGWTQSDNDGAYSLSVPSGSDYSVTITKTGYQLKTYNTITITADSTTTLDPVLVIDPGSGGISVQEIAVCTSTAVQRVPNVTGNYAVWFDFRSGHREIYARNLTTGVEFKVGEAHALNLHEFNDEPFFTNGPAPAVSGNYVVWEHNADIYGYNLTAEQNGSPFPMSTDTGIQVDPYISGNRVVWSVYNNQSHAIYGYDISTGIKSHVCDAHAEDNPVIAGDTGNYVVWKDLRNRQSSSYNNEIYGYDISTGEEFAIDTSAGVKNGLVASGNYVVWQNTEGGDIDVFVYDLKNRQKSRLSSTSDKFQYEPAIDGNYVVWCDERNNMLNAGSVDIYAYDLSTKQEQKICSALGIVHNLRISGDYIVWCDNHDGFFFDIYGYDITTKEKFPICTMQIGKIGQFFYPEISGNCVVWEDSRNDTVDDNVSMQYDIYGAVLTKQ